MPEAGLSHKSRHTTTTVQQQHYEPQTLAWFQRVGIVLDKDGLPQQTHATRQLLEIERLRESKIQRTPSAPRYLMPDAAGQGVTRNAWSEPLTERHLRQYGRKSPVAVKARYACVSQVSSGCELVIGGKKHQSAIPAGVKVVHKDHFRDRPVPDGFLRMIERAEDMLETPFDGDAYSPPVLSLQQLVQGLYGDIFDLNRGVIEPIRRGGEIIGARPADGAIIIPAWETVRHWTGLHGTTTRAGTDLALLKGVDRLEAVSQDIRDRTGAEVDLSRVEWVVYRDGIVEGGYHPGELIVLPMLTSTDIDYAGHPPSYLQLGMEFVAMSWVIHDYHGRKFTDAAWMSMILAVIGEGYDDEAFNEFLNNLRTGKGYQRSGLPHIVHLPEGGDLKAIDTRPPVADAEFKALEEKIESGFCAIIRRHPEIVNGATFSASGPRLSGPSEEMRIRVAREEGQVADVRHIAAYLTRFVRLAVHDDLRVIATFPSADRGAVVDLANKEVADLKTVNEGCVEQGMDPMGFFMTRAEFNAASPEDKKRFGENPWNYPTNPTHLERVKFAMGLTQEAEHPGEKGQPQ